MFRINDSIEFQGKEYVISKFLGQGGMGQVFSIEDSNGNSTFALKHLQHFIPDDNNHRSLINEWEKAQTINHKNVICYHGFHDGLTEPKTPYLIMELAKDGSLEDFLKSQTEFMNESDCLEIFHQIIDGMEAVNEVLVHRDIKPDNIFIEQGIFKIADFGLAKIAEEKTRSKTFKGWGTEPYIAPEAYRAETNTIQMDMYSIGHVFYQIAGMKHAYGLQHDWEKAHLTEVAEALNNVNPNISPKIASIVNKLISKRPSSRYETWDCVRKDMVSSAQNVGSHKTAINNILQKKISRDLSAEKVLSEKQIKDKELTRKSDILNFQFSDEIIRPIKRFVEDFNKVSGSSLTMNISEYSQVDGLACEISFDRKAVKIWFHKINEEDVIERHGKDMWGDQRLYIIKPELNGKPILAWGGIECSDNTGLNIVLTPSDSEEYGDWYLLKNTHSGFGGRGDNRPDPFAFTSDELVKEIHNVNVTHIYNLKVSSLASQNVIDFVSSAL